MDWRAWLPGIVHSVWHTSGRAQFVVAAATGLLYALAFPPFDLWPLVFVAFLPMLSCVHGVSLRRGFALGALAGVLGGLVSTAWLVVATERFLELSWAGGALFLVGVAVWVAVPYGFLMASLVAVHAGGRPLRPFASAVLMTAAELVRGHWQPFPWLFAGHALLASTTLAQLAEVGGLVGLSAIVFFVTSLLGRAVWECGARADVGWRWRASLAVAVAAITVGLVAAFGISRQRAVAAFEVGPTVDVALVQVTLAGTRERPPVAAYVAASLEVADQRPALIVWPEAALPATPTEHQKTLAPLLERMTPTPTHLLTGGVARSREADGSLRLTNSAFLIRGPHYIVGRYDKRRLVPFGEYLPQPFARLFGASAWSEEHFGEIDTSSGAEVQQRMVAGDLRLAILICNEVLLSPPFGPAIPRDADLIVNLSNDNWAASAEIARFVIRMAQLRAIESRRPLVRSTFPGGSGAIAPTGEVVQEMGWGETGARVVKLSRRHIEPLPSLAWPSSLLVAVGAVALLVAQVLRRFSR